MFLVRSRKASCPGEGSQCLDAAAPEVVAQAEVAVVDVAPVEVVAVDVAPVKVAAVGVAQVKVAVVDVAQVEVAAVDVAAVDVAQVEMVRETEGVKEDRGMKIAVTARGPEMTSDVDPRFGRARYFVIIDTETGASETIDNQSGVEAGSGAGVQAAARVAGLGVKYLLTGHCGPNAFRTLAGAGVEVITSVEGTVEDAVAKFKRGELSSTDAADVNGHWT